MDKIREDLARENEQLKAQIERLNVEKGDALWFDHMIRMYKDLEGENEQLKARNARLRIEKDQAIWCANGFLAMFGRLSEKNGLNLPLIPGEKKPSRFALFKFFIFLFYRLFLARRADVC